MKITRFPSSFLPFKIQVYLHEIYKMNKLGSFLPQFLPIWDLVQFVQISTVFEHIKHRLYSKIPATSSYSAARGGHLKILILMKEKGYLELGSLTIKGAWEGAAVGGHLEVMKWLLINEHTPSHTIHNCMGTAALYGHFEVLLWAKEEGCYSWETMTCVYAAMNGQFDTLKRLREHGCPWDKWTLNAAGLFDRLDIFKWALWEGCPFGVDSIVLGCIVSIKSLTPEMWCG